MTLLFTPVQAGTLQLPNRLVRSATAERMADDLGRPTPKLLDLYRELARGGVGLIITGHMYIHPTGKAHPEMTGVYDDDLIPGLADLARAVHDEGGKIVAQINHGGMQCSLDAVTGTIAPSALQESFLRQPSREMTEDEIASTIDSYGQAARRVREAGIDGVQIHAAHGYLVSQFLSPFINRRIDSWGGDASRRMAFLRAVCRAVRDLVGADYPVMIKLGMIDGMASGLQPEESLGVVSELEGLGIDALEISSGVSGGASARVGAIRPGIRTVADEAYFRPFAKMARDATRLPILLVGGLRSKIVMEDVLASGDADLISICRPLICEPDLPNRFRDGVQDRSGCISGNRCWAEGPEEGIACKCVREQA